MHLFCGSAFLNCVLVTKAACQDYAYILSITLPCYHARHIGPCKAFCILPMLCRHCCTPVRCGANLVDEGQHGNHLALLIGVVQDGLQVQVPEEDRLVARQRQLQAQHRCRQRVTGCALS